MKEQRKRNNRLENIITGDIDQIRNIILDGMTEHVVLHDTHNMIVWANSAAAESGNLTKEELVGRYCYELWHKRTEPCLDCPITKALKTGQIQEGEVTSPDGRVWLTKGYPVFDKNGNVSNMIEITVEITNRKHAEQILSKSNRFLKMASLCGEAMLFSTTEQDLLNEMCRIAVEIGGNCFAWIGYAKDDKKKIVKPVSQYGFEEGYLESIKITWDDSKYGRGPAGRAIKTGQPCIVRDTMTDPDYAPWRIEATKRGYKSSIALPLKEEGCSFGALNIYSAEIDAFDENEVKGLVELSRNLSFGIVSLRVRERLERTTSELKNSYKMLQKTLEGGLHAISNIAEIWDPYTVGHQQHVADLAVAIGKKLGLSDKRIERIRIASMIHDIGKISVPDRILGKTSKLNDIEINMIKMHPQTGYDILKKIEVMWLIAKIVLQHHERINGSGYPNGLTGNEILLEAKIIGVADVIEAMASHRPYRPALGIDKAIEEIKQNRGILYDPMVVDACIEIITKEGKQAIQRNMI